MTSSSKGLLVLCALGAHLSVGCSSTFVNRGLQQQALWLQAQVAHPATSADDVPEGETRNYESRFEVQVSPNTNRGAAHDPNERSDLPDLHLYVRINGQRTEVGEAPNAQVLTTTYPLRVKRGDTIEVRLADRRNTYTRWRYDSRETDDWSSEATTETPLAQFSFAFEGPGRYFFHQGYGIFFIDFRPLQ